MSERTKRRKAEKEMRNILIQQEKNRQRAARGLPPLAEKKKKA